MAEKRVFTLKLREKYFPNTSLQTIDQLNTIRLHAASQILEKRKSAGNIRTGNLHDISGQKIYRKYQDRKSTGNIRTGNLHDISGQKIYTKYQDRKSTGNIRTGSLLRTGSLQAISEQESTGNIRTVTLQTISGHEIYM